MSEQDPTTTSPAAQNSGPEDVVAEAAAEAAEDEIEDPETEQVTTEAPQM
jgi:hypothetical protein